MEQNEYNGELTKDAGIRVHIGKPGKVPFPYEKGFSVGPGSATSVGMKMVRHSFETQGLSLVSVHVIFTVSYILSFV